MCPTVLILDCEWYQIALAAHSGAMDTQILQGFETEKETLRWQLQDSYIHIRTTEDKWDLPTVQKGTITFANVTGCNLP